MNNIIKSGFDQIAHQYDEARKSLIPCYTDFYNIIADLPRFDVANLAIADLGAGTGLLSSVLLPKFADATFTLIDISDKMLNVARQRFQGLTNFQYIEADYATYNYTNKFNLIVSGLSVHHLTDTEKWDLYKKLYDCLEPDGIFINGDIIKGNSEIIDKIYMDQWLDKIYQSALSTEEKNAARYRMTFDKPATVKDNLDNMRLAGFVDVDVFYKYYNFAVMFGKKSR